MATSGEFDTRFRPRSTSDSIDGDNSQVGACTSITNLIFDPSTPAVLVCRPAVQQLNPFTGFNNPGVVSAGIQLSGIVYGLVASSRFPGHDEPFAFDISSGDFLTISGVTASNVPISQPTAGDWVPPEVAALNTFILFTHVGFNFPAGQAFGGFDISGFTNTQTAAVNSGNPVISGITTTGINPGYRITDTSGYIPVGTTVINKTASSITLSANPTGTNGSDSITITGGTTSTPLWFAGNLAINPLPTQPTTIGTFSNRFYFGTQNVLAWSDTLALTATAANQAVFIGDHTFITAISPMSLSTTTQANIDGLMVFKQNYLVQVTGDAALETLRVNLVSDEVGTAAPRSLGLCPDGLRFMSVDGIRLIQLSGVMTLPDPDLALPFIYSLYPSRVSAAFNNNTYRICTQNGSPAATGTPIEEYWFDLKRAGWTGPHTFEQDLALPYKSTFIIFSNTFSPSIWQSDVVQNNADEFVEVGTTNYVAEDGVTLYVAEDGTTEYTTDTTGVFVDYVAEDGATPYVTEDGLQNYIVEGINGTPMEFLLETVPMTDFDNIYANELVNSTLDMAIPSNGVTYIFTALNEVFASICTATITAPAAAAIWGQFIWGLATWGAIAFGLQPQTVPWSIPVVFNRLSLSISGTSSAGLKLGSFHMTSKRLKYLAR